MNAIDKLKALVTNFKESQNVTSIITLIGTIVTDNGVQFAYALIAIYVQYHNARASRDKATAEIESVVLTNERARIDNALYKEERELANQQLRLDLRERELKLNDYESNTRKG